MKTFVRKSIAVLALVIALAIQVKADELAGMINEVKKTKFADAVKDEVVRIAPECRDFLTVQLNEDASCAYGFAKTKSGLHRTLAKLSTQYYDDLMRHLQLAKAPTDRIIPTKELQLLYNRDKIRTYQDLEDRRAIILSMKQEFENATKAQLQLAYQWEQKATKLWALQDSKQKQ
jgi:hypothetical protein